MKAMETEKQYVYTSLRDLKLKYFPETIDQCLEDQDPKRHLEALDLLKKCCEKEKSERRTAQIAARVKSAKFRQK
jgi:DNA replication protein DnaC